MPHPQPAQKVLQNLHGLEVLLMLAVVRSQCEISVAVSGSASKISLKMGTTEESSPRPLLRPARRFSQIIDTWAVGAVLIRDWTSAPSSLSLSACRIASTVTRHGASSSGKVVRMCPSVAWADSGNSPYDNWKAAIWVRSTAASCSSETSTLRARDSSSKSAASNAFQILGVLYPRSRSAHRQLCVLSRPPMPSEALDAQVGPELIGQSGARRGRGCPHRAQ